MLISHIDFETTDQSTLQILVNNVGMLEIREGVWFCKKDACIEDQKTWDARDSLKDFDFKTSDYWLLTDTGTEPVPFNDVPELQHYMCA